MAIRFIDEEPLQVADASAKPKIRFVDEEPQEKIKRRPLGASRDIEKPSLFGKIQKGVAAFGSGMAEALPRPYETTADVLQAEKLDLPKVTKESFPENQGLYGAGKMVGQVGEGVALSGAFPGAGYGPAALQGLAGSTPQAVESISEGKPVDAAVQLATGLAFGPAYKGVGEVLKGTAKKGFSFAMKPEKYLRDRGIDMATITKHKVGGTVSQILNRSQKKIDELTGTVRVFLDKAKNNTFDMNSIMDDAEKEIVKNAKGTKFMGMVGDLKNELAEYRQAAKDMAETYGYDLSKVDIDFLNDFRKSIGPKTGPFVPQKQADVSLKASNGLYGKIRNMIDDAVGDPAIKVANKDLEDLIKINQAARFAKGRNTAGILPLVVGAGVGGGLGAASGGPDIKDKIRNAAIGAAGVTALRSTVPATVTGFLGRNLSDRTVSKVLSGYLGSKAVESLSPEERLGLYNELQKINEVRQ